jgi:flagellar protein FliS
VTDFPLLVDISGMSYASQASYEYLRNTVLTASPEQLQLMLLDGAIRFAQRGREAIEKNQYEASFNALERAQRIVIELIQGMNRQVNPPLVDQMVALYDFIFRRLVEGHLNRDVKAIDDALRILRHQRETWALLIEKLAREAAHPASSATPGGQDPGASLLVEG